MSDGRVARAKAIMQKVFADIQQLGVKPHMAFGCMLKEVTNPTAGDFEFYQDNPMPPLEPAIRSLCENITEWATKGMDSRFRSTQIMGQVNDFLSQLEIGCWGDLYPEQEILAGLLRLWQCKPDDTRPLLRWSAANSITFEAG